MSSSRVVSGPNTMAKFPVVGWSEEIYTPKPVCDSMEIFFTETYKKIAELGLKRHSRPDKSGKPASPHTFKTPKPPRPHIDGRRINLLEKATVALKESSTIQFRYNIAGAAIEWPASNSIITERLKTLDRNFDPKSPGTIKSADITQLLLVGDIFNKAVFMCLPSATYRPKDKQRTGDADHAWGEVFILTPFEVLQVLGSLHVRYLHGDQLTDAELRKEFEECMESLFAIIKKHKSSEEHFLTPPPMLQIADDVFMPVCETEVYLYWKPDALKQPQATHYISAPKSPAFKRTSSSSSFSKKKSAPKKKQQANGEEEDDTCRPLKKVRGPSGNLDEASPLPGENIDIKKLMPKSKTVSDDEGNEEEAEAPAASSKPKHSTGIPKKPVSKASKASKASSEALEGEETEADKTIRDLEFGLTKLSKSFEASKSVFSTPDMLRSILLKHFSSAATLKKVHAGTKKQVNNAANRYYKTLDPTSNVVTLKGMLADYVPDETMELPPTMWSALAYCAQDEKPELKSKLTAMLKTMEAPSKDLAISLLTPMDRRHRSAHEPAILAALMVQGVKLTDELMAAMSVVGDAVSAPLSTDIQCLESVAREAKELVQRMKEELDDSQTVVGDLQGKFKESQATAEKLKEQLAQSVKGLKAIEPLQVEVANYRTELEEVKAANEKNLAELKSAYEARLKASKKETAFLKDQLATARTEIQEMKDIQLSSIPADEL